MLYPPFVILIPIVTTAMLVIYMIVHAPHKFQLVHYWSNHTVGLTTAISRVKTMASSCDVTVLELLDSKRYTLLMTKMKMTITVATPFS